MPEKRKFPLLPSINSILTALIISLVIAWFIREPLVNQLTGYPLSVRRPLVQVGFTSLITLILALILLLAARKPLAWLQAHGYLAFFGLPVITLSAHAYIGWFSRFVADDFSSATLAVNKGLLGATWDWYVNWSGRFTASFFDSLFGYLGPSSLRWETGGTLVLLLVGSSILTWQLLRVRPIPFRLGASIFLPASILVAAFRITPDLPQSLYWGQGMRSLIFPLVPAAFLASILVRLRDHSNAHNLAGWLSVVALLSFLAGGFGETYVALQTTILLLFILVIWFEKPSSPQWKSLSAPVIGLVFSLAAMAVTVAAPGNNIRQSYFPPSPGILSLAQIAANSTGLFLQRVIVSADLVLSLLVLFLSSIACGWLCANHGFFNNQSDGSGNHPFFTTFSRSLLSFSLIFSLLLYASFVPAAYGMSSPPPDRTVILPTIILCVYVSIAGFLVGNELLSYRFWDKLPAPFVQSILWVLLFLYAAFTFQVTTRVLAVSNDYQRFAAVFDRADRLIREAKAAGKTSVQVPEVHNHFGLSDYGAGTTYWLDQAVDGYYGIHVTVNKNMK